MSVRSPPPEANAPPSSVPPRARMLNDVLAVGAPQGTHGLGGGPGPGLAEYSLSLALAIELLDVAKCQYGEEGFSPEVYRSALGYLTGCTSGSHLNGFRHLWTLLSRRSLIRERRDFSFRETVISDFLNAFEQHASSSSSAGRSSGHSSGRSSGHSSGRSPNAAVLSFVDAKRALAEQRSGHLYDACKRAVGEMGAGRVRFTAATWATWLSGAAGPSASIPPELATWDASLGGTWAVDPRPSLVRGLVAPFAGRVTFDVGDMIAYGHDLAAANLEERVAMLNMANAHHPGGGFLSGARAQEEQLCHRSTLFLRLRAAQARSMYPIDPGTGLVTPNVTLLRDAGLLAFATPSAMGVVSVAARYYANEEEALRNPGLLRAELVAAWHAVLDGARALNATTLVVSALGAGAFHNPPEVVGEALGEALQSCVPCPALARIAVVVFDDHNAQRGAGNVARMRQGLQAGTMQSVELS